ncbi:MAG: aminopeptidase P family N-terminal domain-containing protein [Devosia sp.]
MPVRLIDAALPDFGVPAARPELPRALYAERLDALGRARRGAGLDALLIYADREHAANMAWLTGFDPRFEEALLILVPATTPTLLAGPENLGRAQHAMIEVEARLYPPFGLLGQDRSQTPALEEVLTNAGLKAGQRIGVLGWKYFGPYEATKPEGWLETPAFMVDILRKIAGPEGRVVNANGLLMDASHGLRAINEVEQLAQFEFGAVMASEAIKALIANLQPGMSEFAAVQAMGLGVLPHSCHTMLSTGTRLSGLESPSGKIIERGDPLTTAVGYWGGLSSRVGWVVEDAAELPANARDYVEKLAIPYFACAAEWYSTIGIGVEGGTLDALARRHLGAPFFNLVLNPGHLIHLDEWMNTPIYPGSKQTLKSGQAIQCDIIPAVGPPYHSANIEDGIALLDAAGRDELAEKYPEIAARIEARRAFMQDVLGIRLKAEILPLSNLAGALSPFLLAPRRMLAMR